MLDRAKEHGFAYPAINVTSSQTLNAALRGFADAGSDGIVQISTGGAEYLSGQAVKDMVTGAVALRRSSPAAWPSSTRCTSPCTPTTAPRTSWTATCGRWSALSKERVARGGEPLFQSHMWDGSAVPLAENLSHRRRAPRRSARRRAS